MFDFKYDKDGLIVAIIQDASTGEVLMQAYMNKEAVEKTLATGNAHFYSRSRKKLWLKGETSGHVQKVKEILTDCDRDALLIKVEQTSGACHLGYRSCFVFQLDKNGDIAKITQDKVFDPEKTYKDKK